MAVIHVWGVCDSTSAIFGRGECEIILHIFMNEMRSSLVALLELMQLPLVPKLHRRGSRFFFNMYGEKPCDILDIMK